MALCSLLRRRCADPVSLGLSPAFGAFLAGLIVGNSAQRQPMFAVTAKPIQSVLMMVFFLSIGLLIDLRFIWENPGVVLSCWLFTVTVIKTALNIGVLGICWASPGRVAFLAGLTAGPDRRVLVRVRRARRPRTHWIIGTPTSIADRRGHRSQLLMSSPLWLAIARRIQHHGCIRCRAMSLAARHLVLTRVETAAATAGLVVSQLALGLARRGSAVAAQSPSPGPRLRRAG